MDKCWESETYQTRGVKGHNGKCVEHVQILGWPIWRKIKIKGFQGIFRGSTLTNRKKTIPEVLSELQEK